MRAIPDIMTAAVGLALLAAAFASAPAHALDLSGEGALRGTNDTGHAEMAALEPMIEADVEIPEPTKTLTATPITASVDPFSLSTADEASDDGVEPLDMSSETSVEAETFEWPLTSQERAAERFVPYIPNETQSVTVISRSAWNPDEKPRSSIEAR